MAEVFVCPCCGYEGLDHRPYQRLSGPPVSADARPPYEAYFGMPSYEVCACCGFEFGNDDNPGTAAPVSFRSYLNEWVADGAEWFSPDKQPADWSLHHQLRAAGITPPD